MQGIADTNTCLAVKQIIDNIGGVFNANKKMLDLSMFIYNLSQRNVLDIKACVTYLFCFGQNVVNVIKAKIIL